VSKAHPVTLPSAKTTTDLPFEPLRDPVFRRMWTGVLCLNLCLWVEIVTAGWMMVSMAASSLMVGLIQSAATLPTFLLALPAGALADRVDRQLLLVRGMGCLSFVAVAATLLAGTGMIGPALLMVVTFAFGATQAMLSPSAFTTQMDVLPDHQKLAGMALGSASYSSARAVGPALAGAIIAAAGTTAALWFTVALAVLGTVLLSRARRAAASPLPALAAAEPFRHALHGALRVAKDNALVRRELLGTSIFVLCASGLWALLPLVAREGAGGYGTLLGSIGGGTVIGSLLLQAARRRLTIRQIELVGALAFCLGTGSAAWLMTGSPVLYGSLALGGIGWAWVGNLRITIVQTCAPPTLRARTLALYLIAFQGSMAVGGAAWGALADALGLQAVLFLMFGAQAGAALLLFRWRPAD
jgi:MFS family permease